jgi:hypothetical protein
MKKDDETERGWNKGVYGDGSTYGMGAKKSESHVTVNRVKGPKSTNGFFEKNLSFGGKKMVVEIHHQRLTTINFVVKQVTIIILVENVMQKCI